MSLFPVLNNESLYLTYFIYSRIFKSFPGGVGGKEPACRFRRRGRCGSIPGSGRSPREGNGNPLQYSCLDYLMDRGAWQAIVRGVIKSWIQLKQLKHSTAFLNFCL